MVSYLMVSSPAPYMTSVCVCVETSFVTINLKDVDKAKGVNKLKGNFNKIENTFCPSF